ncbi:multi-sensor hybrid histidine kinase [Stylonychia lemnae]|uniref:Multi-sensor hybrid histidine kinase n=1 Tax=Stylonychia lemnae TaxID=5949 RepID=A0A077ZZS4_STYLE|nr:multi-sensor hybrid histidine kinase [Stylonychia lemnae]|eukprot:CDW74713.1 multi-sensor hybrid histidine kinase [Stylonychia lemnae]
MNSKILLKITDKNLQKEYILRRNKEICIISSLIFLSRIIIFIAHIVSAVTNQRIFIFDQWAVRVANSVFHLLILGLAYKFPLIFSELHAPLLTISFCANLFHVSISKNNPPGLVSNVIGYAFFMISGLITNSRWIYTAIAMTVTMTITCAFYATYMGLSEVTIMIQYICVALLTMYSSYQNESRMKTEYIQMEQIKKMNNDLQSILMNFPEGIVLFNQDKEQIVLANQEFKRIFNCPNAIIDDMKSLGEKFNSNMLKPVNFLNRQENDGLNQKDNKLNQKYSLNDAPLRFTDGQCFQIEDDFEEALRKIDELENNTKRVEQAQKELVTLKESKIFYQSNQLRMIMIKSLTPIMKYEKLKLENHFYEMLTATVSHDMRTPLNAMTGLLDSIKTFIGDNQKGLRLLKVVDNSCKILLSLVNDLLDFSQIKNGKFRKNEQIVDIKKSVQDALDIIKLAVNEKGLELRVKFDSNIPPELITDGPRINQVLLNLLQNALKFTSFGYIQVSCQFVEGINTLKFSVKDTGIGIKNEDKSKLFTLFGKIESTNSMNTSGVGLGLNICKQIVEMLGGVISVSDNLNEQGTTFNFTVICFEEEGDVKFNSIINSARSNTIQFQPVDDGESDQLVEHKNISLDIDDSYEASSIQSKYSQFDIQLYDNPPVQASQKKRMISRIPCSCRTRSDVLVVDDNIFNIVTLQTILEYQFNISSDKAMNGQEAVDIVKHRIAMNNTNQCICYNQRQNYKVIFMDCNMPIMDGFQATSEIRNLTYNDELQIFIVALTAYTTENFKQKSADYGMDIFMNKPVTADCIRQILINHKVIDG